MHFSFQSPCLPLSFVPSKPASLNTVIPRFYFFIFLSRPVIKSPSSWLIFIGVCWIVVYPNGTWMLRTYSSLSISHSFVPFLPELRNKQISLGILKPSPDWKHYLSRRRYTGTYRKGLAFMHQIHGFLFSVSYFMLL